MSVDAVERAIVLFNEAAYREALLAFEERWFAERSDFWKALIQLCNGLLQLELGLVSGPRRTLASAHDLLAVYAPRYAGFDVDGLLAYVAAVRAVIPATSDASVPWEHVPRMSLRRDG